ncbi:hypothetical protein ACA910_012245 [Epithemia clementina (nom. ined.)]
MRFQASTQVVCMLIVSAVQLMCNSNLGYAQALSLTPPSFMAFATTASSSSTTLRVNGNSAPHQGGEATKNGALFSSSMMVDDDKPKLLVRRVAVVGATGRTGRLVVQELLNRGAEQVVAMVRSKSRAQDVLLSASSNDDGDDVNNNVKNKVKIVECDLTNARAIETALQGMDAAIWCATGFSTNEDSSMLDKLRGLVGIATKKSIDLVGLPKIAQVIQSINGNNNNNLPKVVMCSSAGVTRPTWSDEKKKQLIGAADIPIVRLNPFGILDMKRQSEQALRETGVPYCIVRPSGLNDSWPAGSRPILTQGDVAVGRINRQDVATLLVDMLSEPDAVGKTMEVIGLANYPKPAPSALTKLLQSLVLDSTVDDAFGGELPMERVMATYSTLQQLLPGEKQNSAALAMGQTYEQYDQGQTGRLGKRGQENALAAAPKPTNQ